MMRFLLLVFSLTFYSFSESAMLDMREVELLKEIVRKLGLRGCDFEKSCNDKWICDFYVSCDCSFDGNTTCHIIKMDIDSRHLSAPLPLEFADLHYLQSLYMSHNYLTGNIPSEWATMRLSNLSLSGNQLSGSFPMALTKMTNLLELDIEGNRFSGSIPNEIANMKNMQKLVISSNYFTGSLPVGLAKLTNLTEMRISDNNFIGKIPSFIGRWTQIQILHIQGCSFEGPIPSSISQLTHLNDLRISDLKGGSSTFPPLKKHIRLTTLVLRNCLLHGRIPDYFAEMMDLRTLDLSFNNLTSGEIPYAYRLQDTFLTKNKLTGPMPEWIFESTRNVDISYNDFTWDASVTKKCPKGTINIVGGCTASTNTDIPPCLRKDFPCTKPNAQQIFSININCGGKETYINNTIFDEDREGNGPSSFYENRNWAFSNTGSFLNYQGFLTPYMLSNNSELQNISTYDTELYTTARTTAISLTYYVLCLMNGNYNVKLHFAEIVFCQDNTSNVIGKRVFNVIVQGKLKVKDFNIVKEAGGTGRAVIKSFNVLVKNNTLMIQLYWAGKGTTGIPTPGNYGPIISAISVYPNFKPPNFGRSNKHGLAAGLGSGGGVLLLAILAVVILWRKRRIMREHKDKSLEMEIRGARQTTGIFTNEQIKNATKNFDPSNKLGEGGFGAVYKGELRDGTIIAVKQLATTSKQGTGQLLNEVDIISGLNHENLVKLYGLCAKENTLCLIYEYMHNNSLARALFDSNGGLKSRLTWPVRFKICKDIAKGLAYLHQNQVIHSDVKPSNVLLDQNFNAKISDFGLAKFVNNGVSRIQGSGGTPGYMALEYAMNGILTTKADVYSFGVVALELVSGESIHKNIHNFRDKGRDNLIHRASTFYKQGSLLEMADKDLRKKYKSEEALRILNIAVLSTDMSMNQRPTMSEVVDVLDGNISFQNLLKRKRISTTNHTTSTVLSKFWCDRSEGRQPLEESFTRSFVTPNIITEE